ncbi:hypothetical protein BgiMline_012947 [Biomphalaria glabrata]
MKRNLMGPPATTQHHPPLDKVPTSKVDTNTIWGHLLQHNTHPPLDKVPTSKVDTSTIWGHLLQHNTHPPLDKSTNQ